MRKGAPLLMANWKASQRCNCCSRAYYGAPPEVDGRKFNFVSSCNSAPVKLQLSH